MNTDRAQSIILGATAAALTIAPGVGIWARATSHGAHQDSLSLAIGLGLANIVAATICTAFVYRGMARRADPHLGWRDAELPFAAMVVVAAAISFAVTNSPLLFTTICAGMVGTRTAAKITDSDIHRQQIGYDTRRRF